jgi:glycosyltransferase involved in cell wall biosynthesis
MSFTVLQIIPSLHSGGAERTTVDIARALVRAGHTALVASEGGRMAREVTAAGGELIEMPAASKNPFVIMDNAGQIAGIIRERNVGLLHARSRAPAWSALIAAKRTGIPLIATYHGIYGAWGPLKRFYNSVMVKGDATIANSEWTAEHIRKEYPEKVKRLVTIPRGIDLDYFDPAKVTADRVANQLLSWKMSGNERVVLLPGRLTRWKGQLVLLKALSLLKASGRLPKDVRAAIAGDAQAHEDYVAELAQAIQSEGLDSVVFLDSHVTDMPAAYLASDIVVSASTEPEAFGRVPPEAAAMGLPVIATDHGGARETVVAGQSGLLTPPGDAAALADALADLLGRTPEQLAKMGAKGRAHVAARFTVERMCAGTLALYRDLIERQVETQIETRASA